MSNLEQQNEENDFIGKENKVKKVIVEYQDLKRREEALLESFTNESIQKKDNIKKDNIKKDQKITKIMQDYLKLKENIKNILQSNPDAMYLFNHKEEAAISIMLKDLDLDLKQIEKTLNLFSNAKF